MSLFSDASSAIADEHLRRAYVLAERGRGVTSPNPMVGCVIVRDGVVVGEGYHEAAGAPHAEIRALEAAGERARGATAYVTLEPCNHYGRTPPCVPALLKAGITEVVIGMRDPNPEVTGDGAGVLSSAGVKVRFAEDDSVFRAQNEAWLMQLASGRPWVTMKQALSLDAKPTLTVGRRAHITSDGGTTVTMMLRSRATAIAVGAATAAVDDPALTVRDSDGNTVGRQPLRVVLARTSVPRPSLGMLNDGRGPVVLVVSDRADERALDLVAASGAQVVRYPYTAGIQGALAALGSRGVNDVLVEAGPALGTALYRAECIDELVLVTAGGMAGNAAPPAYLGPPDAHGADLEPRFSAREAHVSGEDAVTVWRPRSAHTEPGRE
ncbi:MAG: bifunctional diaminohydroxyphosphoribosylaminopyrimidine deaminase/5-amino-6-(5-phosphoribosylamino)uracil reductase RibD [Coriobacteriales bacterium]